jgi:transposase
MTNYPDWVLKYKKKGTLVQKKKDDLYYMYRVHSQWNKEKKRAQLITDEFLGKITPDGFMEPKTKRIMRRFDQIAVKEYGASFLLHHLSADLVDGLKNNFPEWKEIFVFACMRLLHNAPLKNVEFLYATSYMSEMVKDAHVSPDSLGDMLRRVGMDRNAMIRFMKSMMRDDRYLAVDLTHVLSMSDGIISATLGHNSMDEYLPQVQVLFLYSLDHERPSYFRVLPGSINSVASLKMTMLESDTSNIVLVADSGFYSAGNIKDLDALGISYIMPLKRNSRIISYDHAKEKHFMFQDHPIFYWKYSSENHSIMTFRNDFLKAEEEKDFLRRNGNVKESVFAKARERMGTISVITNLRVSGEIVYDMLKSRTEIEQAYDTFKNTIHADRSYMRDDHQLQGWIFTNFMALMLHYRIYAMLKSKNMQRKYSPQDVLVHLERMNKLKIGDEWKTSEIPKKSKIIIDGLGIPIM